MKRYPVLAAALVLWGPALAVATAQDAPKVPAQEKAAEAVEGDLKTLQGKWKAMIGPQRDLPLVVVFQGKTLSATIQSPQGDAFVITGELKLDAKATPHKTVDWLHFKTPNGDEAEPNLGIYKFEKDEWIVCNGGPGNPRPSAFQEDGDGPPNLIKFVRVQD